MISVNILTWNTFRTTVETLVQVNKDLKEIPHQTVIVDNGSDDGCELIATVKNKVNRGISVGKNQGIKKSIYKYIMMIDGDISIVPNSINCLLDYMEKHTDIMALGFMPNKFTTSRADAENFCHSITEPEEVKRPCLYYGLFRREVFKRCMMDEQYGPGYGWEDLDFYEQMARAGIKQYMTGINHKCGKYYHEINSSIRQGGHRWYEKTSKERHEYFKEKWDEALYKC